CGSAYRSCFATLARLVTDPDWSGTRSQRGGRRGPAQTCAEEIARNAAGQTSLSAIEVDPFSPSDGPATETQPCIHLIPPIPKNALIGLSPTTWTPSAVVRHPRKTN